MGLVISHGCWSASYHAFEAWREALRRVAPPPAVLPGSGGLGAVDRLHQLLTMPDDQGEFSPTEAADLANRLEALILRLPIDQRPPYKPVKMGAPLGCPDARAATRRFVAGLRHAAERGESVVFNPPETDARALARSKGAARALARVVEAARGRGAPKGKKPLSRST